MYLDTDITMALIGLDDILLETLEPIKIDDPKTSIYTIFEINDILSETSTNLKIRDIQETIVEQNIELLPLTSDILETAFKVVDKYDDLILFDFKHGIHAAHCIKLKETILSTDIIYKKIGEIKYKNPSKYENQNDLSFSAKSNFV